MSAERLKNVNIVNVKECRHGIAADVCSACHPELDRDYRPSARRVVHRLEREPTDEKSQPEGIHLWGTSARPSDPPDEVKILHISVNPLQQVLNEILERHQNLRAIQMTKGRFNQYIAHTGAKQLLEQGGVEVVIGRWSESGQSYLNERESWDYHDKREFLRRLDEEQREELERIARLGFDEEINLTERYFCLADPEPPRIGYVDLGAQYGLGWKKVRKRVMGVLGFLDYPSLSDERSIQSAVVGFQKRVKRAIKAESEAAIRTQYEEFCPLPQGLRSAHWETFLQLTRIREQSPELLKSLSDRRIPVILHHYYGFGDRHHTLEETGNLLYPSISNERVRQLKNIGLRELGILKE